jgi:CubicO group peptidase (beta-lactamase class C family)
VQTGIGQRAFPGASIAVTHRGRLIALKGLGRFTYSLFSRRVKAHTIYDLASLTKVIVTTAVCMRLYDQGKFHLGQELVEVLPEFGGDDPRRARVTFRMLLAHSSGLPGYVKLFEVAKDRTELLAQAAQIPLAAEPDARTEYSDIGFILLGAALERLTKETLDEFSRREIFGPLDVASMGFNLGFNFPRHPFRSWTPPTEDDTAFRHRVVQGEVHDENAWVMGGVAGHAGCFATAYEVAIFAETLLNGGAPLFKPHTVELFTRRQASPADTSRALGWDTPSSPSQSGKYFSPRSYGHLGYTGTSLWIDPERQLSVTLLTNRTWPDRSSQAIKQIRPAFHDAVVEAVDQSSK